MALSSRKDLSVLFSIHENTQACKDIVSFFYWIKVVFESFQWYLYTTNAYI